MRRDSHREGNLGLRKMRDTILFAGAYEDILVSAQYHMTPAAWDERWQEKRRS